MNPSQPIKRHWAFAVPFFTTMVAESAALNQRLIAELNASRSTHVFSHLHGNRYENTYVDPKFIPSARGVFDLAESVVSQIMKRPMVVPREADQLGRHWFWFNETAMRGGVTKVHNHWTSWTVFSGCYYVKVPPNSGNLVFSRQRTQTMADGVLLRDSDFFGDVEVPPSEGLLVLFPSWVDHLVRPNESDDSRISLAFNLRLADGKDANFTTSAVVNG